MRRKVLVFIQLFLITILLAGCTADNSFKYKIGVSQCVGGRWRDKANVEMLSAQYLYDNDVKVIVKNANNNTHLQSLQIDSLVDEGVNLLVVSPNDDHALNASLRRAHERHIPIVFFDRIAPVPFYTAYIGGDNIDAGRQMARYAVRLCRDSVQAQGRRPVVLEITGPMNLSPDRDRHTGFFEVMQRCPDIEYCRVSGNWSYEDSRVQMRRWLQAGKKADVVFCHSDHAAFGARDGALGTGQGAGIRFLGVDGLPGEGIDSIMQGKLAASYIYPTHGEDVIALALRVLEGKKVPRYNTIDSYVVTPQNVAEVSKSSHSLMRQNQYLATIQQKLENYRGFYNTQRTLTMVFVLFTVMLTVAVLATLHAVHATRKANRRMREMNDEQTRFFTNASHQLRTPLTLIAGPLNLLAKGQGDSRKLIEMIRHNVEQLQHLVTDVLLFRHENRNTIDDTTVPDEEQMKVSDKCVQDARHDVLLNGSNDELATVLVVDDNADMRAYLRTLLLDRYYVIEASDGQSGLRLAIESVPDLVVSDVMMPVMDGLTLCSHLKHHEATSHIPVLLLTARSTEQQYIEGMQTGADLYMTKPFSAELLLANIVSLLDNRQRLRMLFSDVKADDAVSASSSSSSAAPSSASSSFPPPPNCLR